MKKQLVRVKKPLKISHANFNTRMLRFCCLVLLFFFEEGCKYRIQRLGGKKPTFIQRTGFKPFFIFLMRIRTLRK